MRRTCEDSADVMIWSRHEHSWVTPRIALGSGVWDASDVGVVVDAGITDVLDCRGDSGVLYRGAPVSYFACPAPDDGAPKPVDWFLDGVAFAAGALRTPTARVLIHCTAGINRSPAMCYALLRLLGDTAADAAAKIARARPLATARYYADAECALEMVCR